MSSSVEYEGKNVEMAIQNACKDLNIPEEELEHEVLSYGSTGIFGLVGVKKARIRVFLFQNRDDGDDEKIQDKNTQEPKEQKADMLEERPDDLQLAPIAEEGQKVLKDLLGFISDDTQIGVDIKGNRICYNVNSADSGMLIGKRGQTLDAIQYIVEKIINKTADSRIRIQIDIEGYLESRKDNLKELAYKLSNKAKKTGKPVTVGHMSAHDRRIIHVALKNDKKVRTQSMGDGLLRKIVIFPKRRPNNNRKKAARKPVEK